MPTSLADIPSIMIHPPSPTVSFTTVPRPGTTVIRQTAIDPTESITVPRPGTTVIRQSAIGSPPTVLHSSIRSQRPTITRSASVTIVEDEHVRVRYNSEREILDQLQSILNVNSDAAVISRVRSLSSLEQEYCRELVATHEKQKALNRVLADARQLAAQQRLQARIDCKDRELDSLARRAARLDSFNRDVLARVAIRTAAHSDAEKRILRSRIEQQNRQIRDLEKQLREARTTPRRGKSMGNR